MSKRRGDDRQIDRSDYEAQEDEDCEDAGTFQKASADVLAARRIVRTKRTSNEATPVVSTNKPAFTSTNPFSNVNLLNNVTDSKITTSSNPFGGFTGLADKNTSFGGFTGQADRNTSNIIPPKSQISVSSKPLETVPPATQVPLLSKSYASNAQNNSHQYSSSEFQAKIKKLNETFSSWLDQQIVEHPVSIWRDGVQDYIKYVTLLTDKYASSEDTADTGKKSITSAPTTSMTLLNGSTSTLTSSFNSNSSSSLGFTAQSSGIGSTTSTTASTFSFNPPPLSTTATSTSATTGVFGFPIASTSTSNDTSKDKPAVASLSFVPPATSFITTTPLAPFTGFGQPSNFKPTSTTTSTLPSYPTTSFNFTGFGGSSTSSSNSNFSTPLNPVTLNTGFGFGLGASATTATHNENDGEDEEVPLLPPEVVLKNEADKDEVLHDVPCKLFRFDKEKNEWTESGKGTLRVTKDIETMKQRILIRNAIGKISLNASFYKGMKFEKSGKNGIRFAAATGGGSGTELMTYLVKLKPTDIDSTFNILVKGENSVN